jgi:hypothetical protein
MAIELTSRYGADKNHYLIKLSQISPIPWIYYMASKCLRYHNRCPFNHESEGISMPRSNLSLFSGNDMYRSRSFQNALQHEIWSKSPGLHPVSGSAMAAPFIRSNL